MNIISFNQDEVINKMKSKAIALLDDDSVCGFVLLISKKTKSAHLNCNEDDFQKIHTLIMEE
jgi:hypothetical protein